MGTSQVPVWFDHVLKACAFGQAGQAGALGSSGLHLEQS